MSDAHSGAMVFGRVRIRYNGEWISTDRAFLFFNSPISGKHRAVLDETGIFSLKLPAGSNHIARVGVKPALRSEHAKVNLGQNRAAITIRDPSQNHYVGDILLEWKGPKKRQSMPWVLYLPMGIGFLVGKMTGFWAGIAAMLALIGIFAPLMYFRNDGQVSISVADRKNETWDAARSKYRLENRVLTSLIEVGA